MPRKNKKQTDTALTVKQDFDKALAAKLPAWIPEKEDVATSMFEAGQEMLLVVDDVLVRYFQFTEEQIKEFHKRLEPILKGVEEFEKYGFNLLSPDSVKSIGNLVQTRLIKNRMTRAGIEYPFLPGAEDFLKQLVPKTGRRLNPKK